jgi:hypothetical protein
MTPKPLPQPAETELAQLALGVPPETIGRVLMDAVLATTRGEEVNVEAVVAETGLPYERTAAFMEKCVAALEAQVDEVLKGMQIDPD